MTETTHRLVLPLLAAGQAQKEVLHNEALAALDALVQPFAQGIGIDAPPPGAAPGQSWIVGPAPVGAWAGHARALATLGAGGWRFVVPFEGLRVALAGGLVAVCAGDGWTAGQVSAHALHVDGAQVVGARRGAIADPSGGTEQDAQARAAIVSMLAAMRDHGLIAR